MSLGHKLIAALNGLGSGTGGSPHRATAAEDNLTLELDIVALDRLSCSFNELRLSIPETRGVSPDKLKEWADVVCKRVTYLLEQMGPVEIDSELQQVMARSIPPSREDREIRYYEALFQAPGTLRLNRFQAFAGREGRTQIEMHATREVLQKLANDLAKTAESL